MTDAELETRFHQVRETFFPRSRKARGYTVRRVVAPPDSPSDVRGTCGDGEITVDSDAVEYGGDLLDALLIHELAHIASLWHGQRWRDAMRQALSRAREIQREGLAEVLLWELVSHPPR